MDGHSMPSVCVRVSYMDCEESPNEPHGATGSDPGRVHIGIHFDLSDEESGPSISTIIRSFTPNTT